MSRAKRSTCECTSYADAPGFVYKEPRSSDTISRSDAGRADPLQHKAAKNKQNALNNLQRDCATVRSQRKIIGTFSAYNSSVEDTTAPSSIVPNAKDGNRKQKTDGDRRAEATSMAPRRKNK